MRLPTRLPDRHPLLSMTVAVLIALLMTSVFMGVRAGGGQSNPVRKLDDLLYDAVYGLRTPENRAHAEVVIITVDQKALEQVNGGILGAKFGWPWPRDAWGLLIPYLQQCGAKVIALDLLFDQTSQYNGDRSDDARLAQTVESAKIPIVFGSMITPDGQPGPFAPPLAHPVFGAVNYSKESTVRSYAPKIAGYPSLALRVATLYQNGVEPDMAEGPFRLHFYGPSRRKDKTFTFPYLSAGAVIASAFDYSDSGRLPPATAHGVDPALFRGKIVLVGTSAASLYDLKSSPLDDVYPGVDAHATAIENMLHGQYVHPLSAARTAWITFLGAWIAALGIILPRQTAAKLLTGLLPLALLVGVAVLLFRGTTIYWLPLAAPLLALVFSIVAAFAWSYLTEGRQRKLVFRALSQAVSPEMAAEIERNPDRLKLGGERREMTVMFTDIAGFTDLSETMEVEQLTALMNFYLEEMSSIVLSMQGYVDKYIGDAIMSFWNGPIPQSDHTDRACRAALAMQKREQEIQPQLAALRATGLMTRLGINTGPMALGNMGSSLKFAYTVLGDSVNLGSRLEGANKLYGSQILMAQTTAEQVKDRFVVRQLDLLRVKGKKKPMAVYELMREGRPDGSLQARITQYESALSLYQQQKWDDAESVLQPLIDAFPDDKPAAALLNRVHKLRHDPPGSDWDGVYVAKDK